MVRHTPALILLSVLALTLTGCRGDRAVQHQGGGTLAPAPDPGFGGGGYEAPLLPPAASTSRPSLEARTVSNRRFRNPFRRANKTESTPVLMPAPETGMPEAVAPPTLW